MMKEHKSHVGLPVAVNTRPWISPFAVMKYQKDNERMQIAINVRNMQKDKTGENAEIEQRASALSRHSQISGAVQQQQIQTMMPIAAPRAQIKVQVQQKHMADLLNNPSKLLNSEIYSYDVNDTDKIRS